MGKVLIFGGNQFVGRHVCERLLEDGHQVYVVNRGSRRNPLGAIHLRGDRNNEKALINLLGTHEFEAVIDISAYEPYQMEISARVLDERYKKYIFISSASVYENIGEVSVTEKSRAGGSPVWGDYARNKFLCEEILKNKKRESGSTFTIFRPFYIYGPGNNLDRENYFFNRILDGKPIFIPSGENIVQFGHVRDLANNISLAISMGSFDNKVFNIAGEELLTFRKMIEIMEEIVGKRAFIKEVDHVSDNLNVRGWFPFRAVDLQGDTSKLREAGGQTGYTLREGLVETLEYSRRNNLLGNYELSTLEGDLYKTKV